MNFFFTLDTRVRLGITKTANSAPYFSRIHDGKMITWSKWGTNEGKASGNDCAYLYINDKVNICKYKKVAPLETYIYSKEGYKYSKPEILNQGDRI